MFKENLLLFLTLSIVHSQIIIPKDFPSINIPTITPPSFPNIFGGNSPSNASLECKYDCGWNSISVSGSSTLNVKPDIAIINIEVNENDATTNGAISQLSKRISSVLDRLSKNGLNSSNWQTTSLNVYPNSSYVDGKLVTYGQIASQSMAITIPIVGSNGNSVGLIYDSLAQVKNININGLTFDLRNKTDSFIQARKLAFLDATQKAQDYTDAAKIALGPILTISDSYSVAPVSTPQASQLRTFSAMKVNVATTVSLGTIAINYYINAVFSFA